MTRRAGARRDADAPDRLLPSRRRARRRGPPARAPPRRRLEHGDLAEPAEQRRQLLRPVGDRRREAFEPDAASRRGRRRRRRRRASRDDRARADAPRRRRPSGVPIACRAPSTAASVVEPGDDQRRHGLRPRQHLEGHLGDDGERAPRAGEPLGEVVAGDVLHHAAAGLERLAAPGDGLDAEDMVARRARLDPARAAGSWPRARRRSCRARAARRRAARNPSARRRASGCGRASSRSISASGVPACAESTSSSGS